MYELAAIINVPLSAEQKLYWVDAYYATVESIYLDGSGRQRIAHAEGTHFFDIQLSGDYLIMTDWNSE